MVASPTIPVDFSARELDGAIRLDSQRTTQFIIDYGIQLSSGASVRVSDGEATALGVLEWRSAAWVAKALKWEPE